MIETVERFSCHLCGYITEDKFVIELIKKHGECPACNNAKSKMWVAERKEVKK